MFVKCFCRLVVPGSCTARDIVVRSPFDIVGATDNEDQNSDDNLLQVVLEKTIRIPESLSVRASSILKAKVTMRYV